MINHKFEQRLNDCDLCVRELNLALAFQAVESITSGKELSDYFFFLKLKL